MHTEIRLLDELGGRCEAAGCMRKATRIVYSKKQRAVLLCCDTHSDEILDEDCPEYHQTCPNCGCEIPVN